MSDDTPVPETLESIAQQIRELTTSFAERFDGVDQRFEELKAQLRTEIESVREDVRLVAEALATRVVIEDRNEADHREFTGQLAKHELRIGILEQNKPAEKNR